MPLFSLDRTEKASLYSGLVFNFWTNLHTISKQSMCTNLNLYIRVFSPNPHQSWLSLVLITVKQIDIERCLIMELIYISLVINNVGQISYTCWLLVCLTFPHIYSVQQSISTSLYSLTPFQPLLFTILHSSCICLILCLKTVLRIMCLFLSVTNSIKER